MDIQYLTYDEVLLAHDLMIEKTGGLPGINNDGLVHSVLEHIKNDLYYPTLVDKVTHLMFSLIMNHAFNDANKRTSIACSILFLNKNGYEKYVDSFILKMEDVVVSVAEKSISKKELSKIISSLIKSY